MTLLRCLSASALIMGLSALHCSAQCTDSLGIDADAVLTRCEMQAFEKAGVNWSQVVEGSRPRISFHLGGRARPVDKVTFFDAGLRAALQAGGTPEIMCYSLTPTERKAAQVDLIAVYRSNHLLSERRYDRIVERLIRNASDRERR